ncbi:MAG TPA: hypothetical protein VGH43_17360 [Jatrophihabitans sp.]|jgi:hypothetical protein
MVFRKRAAIALAATVAVVGSMASAVTAADAATAAPVPTVVVHVSGKSVSLSTGHRLHAGRTIFKVVTGKGDHTLQIARLRNGYTLAQAGSDLNKAFGGDVKAVRRVDRNIVFRGGAEARPNKPGWFSVTLPPGQFVFTDQNSNAVTMVKVFGKIPQRQTLPNRARITAYTYGFANTPATIPHKGWFLFTNKADQPHFIEFNHVKQSTTNAQVRRFFKHGAQGRPSFGLPGSYGAGVLTQGQHAGQYIDLPPGKYLIACFWPDFRTGMPHAFMGMWKLVNLT